MNKLEVRFAAIPELRIDGEGGSKLVGYAAVFNSLSVDLGGFRERIAPGAFRQALDSGADIRALADHDSTKLLGRTSNKTLSLSEDERGLKVNISLPDTSYARDLAALMKRGDVAGMSFGFNIPPNGDRWMRSPEGDYAIRELTNIDLREVTVTSIPAYQATEVYLRVAPECAGRAAEVTKKIELVKRQGIYRQILASV